MPRDYKRSRTRKPKSAPARPWLWSVGGFGIGLVVALVLIQYFDHELIDRPLPDPQVTMQPQSSRDADAETAAETTVQATAERSLLPPQGKADYGFYELLPNYDFVVADDSDEAVAGTAAAQRSAAAPKAVKIPGTYILQAGSFRKFADADRRKAELAFQGIESNIQQVVLGDDQIWYRVYVGPTTDLARLENDRSVLRRASIDVLMLRMKK